MSADAAWHRRLDRLQRHSAMRPDPIAIATRRHHDLIVQHRDNTVALVVVLVKVPDDWHCWSAYTPLTHAMRVPPGLPLPKETAQDMKDMFRLARLPAEEVGGLAHEESIRHAQYTLEAAVSGDVLAGPLRNRAWHEDGGVWSPSPEALQLAATRKVPVTTAHGFLGLNAPHLMLHQLEVIDGLVVPAHNAPCAEVWGTYAELAAELERRGPERPW